MKWITGFQLIAKTSFRHVLVLVCMVLLFFLFLFLLLLSLFVVFFMFHLIHLIHHHLLLLLLLFLICSSSSSSSSSVLFFLLFLFALFRSSSSSLLVSFYSSPLLLKNVCGPTAILNVSHSFNAEVEADVILQPFSIPSAPMQLQVTSLLPKTRLDNQTPMEIFHVCDETCSCWNHHRIIGRLLNPGLLSCDAVSSCGPLAWNFSNISNTIALLLVGRVHSQKIIINVLQGSGLQGS